MAGIYFASIVVATREKIDGKSRKIDKPKDVV